VHTPRVIRTRERPLQRTVEKKRRRRCNDPLGDGRWTPIAEQRFIGTIPVS
jgi:hypothetical protein